MKTFLLGLVTICLVLKSYAQEKKIIQKGQYPQTASFKTGSEPDFVKNRIVLIDEKGNYQADSGKIITYETDSISHKRHYRTQQIINGIPVENAVYIQHVLNNKVVASNGVWLKHSSLKIIIRPTMPEKSALNIALRYVSASVYKWQLEAEERLLKNELNDPGATYFPKGSLVYYSGEAGVDSSKLRLAYKFDIYAQTPLSRSYVFIDAANGKVLGRRSLIEQLNTPAIAYTVYSGPQTIQTDLDNGVYRLRETGRGNGIETYNLMKTGNYPAATDFTNTTTIWNNINESKDQYATDAHWSTEKTWDYFYYKFGRNSIDNAGFLLRNYLHYSTDYYNAFWDGYRMTYGDGNYINNHQPFTTLDICGHEISHGLTAYTSSLIYSGESGALNEGFSDIFGTAIENYARPDKWDWIIGGDFGGLRDMSNPNAYSHPDTYKGKYWDPNEEVHTNSGVLNFWFYLLTTGGSGINDINCNYNVNGIGFDKAAAIAYKTNTAYLVSTSNYADAAHYSLMAAGDLFGEHSNEVAQTAAAWAAVGININATVPSVTASTLSICQGSTTRLSVSDGNLNGATYWQWYTSRCGGNIAGTGGVVDVRPDTTTTYFVRGEGGCVAFGDCGSVTIVVNKPLRRPLVSVSGPLTFCEGQSIILSAPEGFAAYKWSNGSITRTITVNKTDSFSVRVTNNSGCESEPSEPVYINVTPTASTPVIAITGSINNCVNGSVILTSTDSYGYKWSTGATTRSITVTKAGSYAVTTFTEGGCSATSPVKEIKFTDNEAPVPVVPSLPDLVGECSVAITKFPTAMDNCSGPITATTTDPLNYIIQGTYSVEWLYSDGNGNISKQRQNVIVRDVSPPVITIPSLIMNCGSIGGIYSIAPATATDNCGVEASGFSWGITGATVRSGKGADASGYFAQGTSVLTFTITDVNGNTAKASSEVVVNKVIVASIEDVYAVQQGGQPNTVYIGYGPTSITLTANVSGGTGKYTYLWSNRSTSSTTLVSGQTPGDYNYTLMATDSKGCSATVSKLIHVVDVRCGNKNDKISICKVPPGNPGNANTNCVAANAVTAQLSSGSYLGACSLSAAGVIGTNSRSSPITSGDLFSVSIWPNPSLTNFRLLITSNSVQPVKLDVIDLAGRIILSKKDISPNSVIYIDENLKAGTYFIRASQNNNQVMVKAIRLSR